MKAREGIDRRDDENIPRDASKGLREGREWWLWRSYEDMVCVYVYGVVSW